ncbi:MAG: hypothetical protein PHQ23_04455 [Candidatus Wallbacteria bacterium]|nr:hypothetical protein [Candidatus Wallbacteria bacterium]
MLKLRIAAFAIVLMLGIVSRVISSDITATLDSSDGSSAFTFRNSDGTPVAHLFSDGNLQLDGTLEVSGAGKSSIAGALSISSDVSIKGGLRLDSAGVFCTTDEMLIVDGKVGIATDYPQADLHVGSGAGETVVKLDGSNAKMRFLNFDIGQSNWIQSGKSWTSGSTAELLFSGINGTPVHMVLDGDGHLGIGESTPTAKLHIGGVSGTDGIKFPDGSMQYSGVRIYRSQNAYGTITNGTWLPGSITFYAIAGQKATLTLDCTGRTNAGGHTYIDLYYDGALAHSTAGHDGTATWRRNIHGSVNVTAASTGNHTFTAYFTIGSGASTLTDTGGEWPLGGLTWQVIVGGT